ncbi:WXG100 family type VII secretion target [Nonomuraea terrae]|uniref:WXG100 family type VII secretion target n=1 Tax=Nonomuraea terrae TaxID=2530383 RepID=UPI0037AF0451
MSVYKEMYWGAAGTATAAAAMIRSPWAFYVATTIGTMVSDPEGMADSARNWRTTAQNGAVSELDDLERGLTDLRNYLKETGTWEGGAFEAFDQVHGDFKDSLAQLKESRNATGEGVESSAGFFQWGAVICTGLAAAMLTLGVAKLASNLAGPVGRVATVVAESVVAKGIITVMQKVFSKHLYVIGTLGGLMYVSNQYAQTAGRIFPGLEAMPTQTSTLGTGRQPFMGTEMTYDEKAGALTPKFGLSGGGYPA